MVKVDLLNLSIVVYVLVNHTIHHSELASNKEVMSI